LTYGRPAKPKFFTDNINAMRLHGRAKSSIVTARTGTYNTGYDIYDLFDLQPLNVTSFDTSANTTTHILIGIDLGTSAYDTNYFALLNHNLFTVEGTIRIAHDTSAITAAGGGTTVAALSVILNGATNPDTGETIDEAITTGETDWSVSNGSKFTVGELLYCYNTGLDLSEVVKVTNIASNVLTVTRAQQGTTAIVFGIGQNRIHRYNCVTPAADYDTMFSFTSSSDRYWAIEIIPNDGVFSGTDLTMGAALLGEAYTMPFAPALEVRHGFNMGGVSVSGTMRGKRFSSSKWIKSNITTLDAGNYIPFRTDVGAQQIPGRETYSMSYPYVTDTDLLPSDIGAPSGNNFAVNVFAKTGWNTLPFIFLIDSASTTQGDFMFARLAGDSYSVTQQAYQVYSLQFAVEQEF
jgi:hypothetical protein